jgi:hypothetical protein
VNAVLDKDAKKILKLKFPYTPEVVPRKFPGGKAKARREKGYTVTSQKQLRALRDRGVQAGEVLNPHGQCGDSYRARYRASLFMLELKPCCREQGMKRKRLRLKLKKAIALEAHELQQMARENATACMETLIEISKNKRAPEATRIAASSVVLDRAYGKASQTSITANITNGKANEVTGEELSKRIDGALKRVEAVTNRAPQKAKGKNRPADLRLYNPDTKRPN